MEVRRAVHDAVGEIVAQPVPAAPPFRAWREGALENESVASSERLEFLPERLPG